MNEEWKFEWPKVPPGLPESARVFPDYARCVVALYGDSDVTPVRSDARQSKRWEASLHEASQVSFTLVGFYLAGTGPILIHELRFGVYALDSVGGAQLPVVRQSMEGMHAIEGNIHALAGTSARVKVIAEDPLAWWSLAIGFYGYYRPEGRDIFKQR